MSRTVSVLQHSLTRALIQHAESTSLIIGNNRTVYPASTVIRCLNTNFVFVLPYCQIRTKLLLDVLFQLVDSFSSMKYLY